ncbi:MAG: diphosphomevalonate decarboxylase [Bacilli bacterium]
MKKITAVSPVNIALIKYWGKSDKIRVTPYNSSISMTLDNLYTKTSIEESTCGYSFYLNGKKASIEDEKKVYDFLKNFVTPREIDKVIVRSTNYVPTAAGVASSSSGFSALALCANEYFDKKYDINKLTEITRLGSGSACRSLLGGFVAWDNKNRVYQLKSKYKDFVLITVIVDESIKEISSRVAMELSVQTANNYQDFVNEGNTLFVEMINALENGDIKKVGELTKTSFLSLHRVMEQSIPKIVYIKEGSKRVLKLVEELFSQGIYIYPTMDAGPNVKILSNENDYQKIIKKLEENGFINYYISRLGAGARIIYE